MWPDNIFNIWPFTTMNICPTALKLQKLVNFFKKYRINPQKLPNIFLIFRQIWSHWKHVLHYPRKVKTFYHKRLYQSNNAWVSSFILLTTVFHIQIIQSKKLSIKLLKRLPGVVVCHLFVIYLLLLFKLLLFYFLFKNI